MSLRVIEIITPEEKREDVALALDATREEHNLVYWETGLQDGGSSYRVILDVQESESALDRLEAIFPWEEEYRIVVYPAEATLPRLKSPEEKPKDPQAKERVSREELYTDVLDSARLTHSYLVMVVLASVVAVVGLLRDNTAVLIGAMVLAPLLGPNVGLGLASTLGDAKLARTSVLTFAVGCALVLAVGVGAGFVFPLPAESHELYSRTYLSLSDLVLALAAGAAGIISVTLGTPASLIGVMVALALLPPLAACGLLLGGGRVADATGAGLLFLANVVGLNLAGVVTFLVQGVRPSQWWEQKRAKAATVRAALIWTVLLAVLSLLTFTYLGRAH